MSDSSGITPINSGPLVIRTYLDQSANNTYLLRQYDYPISSNYVLITSTNGILAPSDNIYVSSITLSTCYASTTIGSNMIVHRITASTISSGLLFYSSLLANTIRLSTLNACTINITDLNLSTIVGSSM